MMSYVFFFWFPVYHFRSSCFTLDFLAVVVDKIAKTFKVFGATQAKALDYEGLTISRGVELNLLKFI